MALQKKCGLRYGMRGSENVLKQEKGGSWCRDLEQNQRIILTESHSQEQYS